MAASSQALYRRRAFMNIAAVALATAAALVGLAFLGWILWTLVSNGLGGMSPQLFTHDTIENGLRNAIVGSALMCAMGLALGTPLGIAAGTWLAEYGHNRTLGTVVRFVNDILLSAPSIVLGLFVYAAFSAAFRDSPFSAVAGSVALAFIVLPVVIRTTDEMLRLVPAQMREAALSLGVPQWKVTLQVLYRAALPGILTGVLLALARISGETAPLLFTALGNNFFSTDLMSEMASLPVAMNQFAATPNDDQVRIAWSGALLLALFVLTVSLIARTMLLRKKAHHD